MPFNANGAWVPSSGYMSFPAMEGFGKNLAPSTPFADSVGTASTFAAPFESAGWNVPTADKMMNPVLPDYTSMAINGPANATTAGAGGWMSGIGDWFKNSGILGSRDKDNNRVDGWGGLALGTAQGLLGGYLGMQQLGVARDTLAQNKKQFELNFGNQVKMTNTQLQDRQAARVASNPGAYQSVGDYMKQNGLKGLGG